MFYISAASECSLSAIPVMSHTLKDAAYSIKKNINPQPSIVHTCLFCTASQWAGAYPIKSSQVYFHGPISHGGLYRPAQQMVPYPAQSSQDKEKRPEKPVAYEEKREETQLIETIFQPMVLSTLI